MRVLGLNPTALLLVQSPPNVAPEPEDQELNEGPKGVEEHDLGYDWCDVLEPLRIKISVEAGLEYFLYRSILDFNSLEIFRD